MKDFNRKLYRICLSLCVVIFAAGAAIAATINLPDFLFSQSGGGSIDLSIIERVRTFSMFKLILFNNTKVFVVFTLGILTCGIISTILLFITGGSLGLGAQIGLGHGGSPSLLLAAILPHGVLEITAFMVVAALGFYFPCRIYKQINGVDIDWMAEAKNYGIIALAAYGFIFLGAIIETFVTPLVAARFISGGHL